MTLREGLGFLADQIPGYLNRKQDERQLRLQEMLALHAQRMQEQNQKAAIGERKVDNARADAGLALDRDRFRYQQEHDATVQKGLTARDKTPTPREVTWSTRVDASGHPYQVSSDGQTRPLEGAPREHVPVDHEPQPRAVTIPNDLRFRAPEGMLHTPRNEDVRAYVRRLKASGVSAAQALVYLTQQGLGDE